METAAILVFLGLFGFLAFRIFVANSRMDKAGDRLDDLIHKEKKYYYIFELLWPFSVFTSKDKRIRERRRHFLDLWLYICLLILTVGAFAIAQALLQ